MTATRYVRIGTVLTPVLVRRDLNWLMTDLLVKKVCRPTCLDIRGIHIYTHI